MVDAVGYEIPGDRQVFFDNKIRLGIVGLTTSA